MWQQCRRLRKTFRVSFLVICLLGLLAIVESFYDPLFFFPQRYEAAEELKLVLEKSFLEVAADVTHEPSIPPMV
jgi:hypothetical protein